MSMPTFPEIPPELSCEQALNMILVSVAMEELALSHILNAESEKLAHLLDMLSCGKCDKPNVKEILEVNQSVASLIDSVSQNQMLLKGKMEKALQAMKDICPVCPKPCPDFPFPEPPFFPFEPPCGSEKCYTVFKSLKNRCKWNSDDALPFKQEYSRGNCACLCDDTYIEINKHGCFTVNLTLNLRSGSHCDYDCDCDCDCEYDLNNRISFCLNVSGGSRYQEKHSYNGYLGHCNTVSTHSLGGIIIDNTNCCEHEPCKFYLYLKSPDSLILENAMLSIVEI